MRTFRFERADRVAAPCQAVAEVLLDLEHYPLWWPQVRAVAKLTDDRAVVLLRSTLPYTLEVELTAVSRSPHDLVVSMTGDLVGHARWQLAPTPVGTRMRFTEDASVGGWLGWASYAAGPALTWNHSVMMRSGLAGLRRRLSDVREDRSSASAS